MQKITALLFLAGLFSFTRHSDPIDAASLGEMLFNDPILSSDQTVPCASCHIPRFAFSDTVAFSKGVSGLGTRNTPGITNMEARPYFFWDGRAQTLEEQVLGPIENQQEMNLPLPVALERLRSSAQYKRYFQAVFGAKPDSTNLAVALAEFVRTLETGNSPFDDWIQGNKTAISAAAVRGRTIFLNKGKCFDCHFGPDFTGDEFRNIGLYNGKDLNDLGRYNQTKKEEDKGKFKVPGLKKYSTYCAIYAQWSIQNIKRGD